MPPALLFHRIWHWLLAASFAIAYASGDEDTYGLHLICGWVMLAVLSLRLALVPLGGIWRLPRLESLRLRPVLITAIASACLLAGFSGLLADLWTWAEHPHETLAQAALIPILTHMGLMVWRQRRRFGLAMVLLAPLAAQAADNPRDAIIASYASQPPSAERGETLFRTRWMGGDERTPACTACHTDNPRQMGQNAKTGRPIDPVAVSVNPKRFTDADLVEKQFTRDCKSVLGRQCSPQEKADYLTFMKGM